MIDYGIGPATDDLEVIVFGPGYGEAVAVHLGDQKWLLVDSCIDPNSKSPASLTYLSSIGVPLANVQAIVASHWHDDHVRGISEIAKACPDAELHISAALTSKEALSLLAAYSGKVAPLLARGTRELYESIVCSSNVFHIHQRSAVIEFATQDGRNVRVSAISPTQAAVTRSVAHFAQFLPQANGSHSIGNITPLSPNSESVVLHVDFEGDAVLLGADLEEHVKFGWTAIATDTWVKNRPRASVYKVAHHGSVTGESTEIWTKLLEPSPTSVMTPFNKGSHALPTDNDRTRVSGKSKQAFISSAAGRKPKIDSASLKRMNDVVKDLRPINNGFGAVRLRKKIVEKDWTVQCFGDAHQL